MDIFRRGGSGRLAKKKAPGQQILRPRTWQGVASEAEGEDEIQGGTNQSHASAGWRIRLEARIGIFSQLA